MNSRHPEITQYEDRRDHQKAQRGAQSTKEGGRRSQGGWSSFSKAVFILAVSRADLIRGETTTRIIPETLKDRRLESLRIAKNTRLTETEALDLQKKISGYFSPNQRTHGGGTPRGCPISSSSFTSMGHRSRRMCTGPRATSKRFSMQKCSQ